MIDVVLFDVDGVLTDGMVYIDSEGAESKRISFDDIDAIFELKRSGVKIGFITGENNSFSEYVRKRFTPDYFISGCKDKHSYFKKLGAVEGLNNSNACFVGDSKKDIALLKQLDYSFVPSDVDFDIKRASKFITHAKRGNGVIKEVAEFIIRNRRDVQILDIRDLWDSRLREHTDVITRLREDDDLFAALMDVLKVLIESLKSGGKILICGNEGSVVDSQHIANELVSRFFIERKALNAEVLAVNTSTLTTVGTDYRFAGVFSRQIEAKGKPGDVLLAISTNGNSENVIEAIKVAKKMALKTVGMTGINTDSLICKTADYCICVPSSSTPIIQEALILIGHILCEIVEKQMFQD